MGADAWDDTRVVIGRPGEAILEMGRPSTLADGSATSIPVRLSAGSMATTTTIELEEWSGGVGDLIAYFEDLAQAWRGWQASKDWDDDGPSISLRATHDGIGLVTLVVSAVSHSGSVVPGSWELQVTIPVEPGSLAALAGRVRLLLEPNR